MEQTTEDEHDRRLAGGVAEFGTLQPLDSPVASETPARLGNETLAGGEIDETKIHYAGRRYASAAPLVKGNPARGILRARRSEHHFISTGIIRVSRPSSGGAAREDARRAQPRGHGPRGIRPERAGSIAVRHAVTRSSARGKLNPACGCLWLSRILQVQPGRLKGCGNE